MTRIQFLRTALTLVAFVSFAFTAAAAPAPAEKSAVKRHPLRGVITRIEPEDSALMVKHEAIPGVMRAMTMRFKVAPDVVKKFKVGDAITGLMSRVDDEWRLDDVKPAKPGKTK
jgi:Cu/Ag efflux protein CusF